MTDRIKPARLGIDASSLCQLKCRSCPINSQKTSKHAVGKGYLKCSDFVALLDRNPFVREVELSNYGEIFLNSQLISIMKEAHERGVRLYADSGANFNHVRTAQLEALVRYGMRSLTCSLDGACDETYGKYRVNGRFDRAISNIRTLNSIKTKFRSRYPKLTWQFIAFGHNEHEISRARAMARELGMFFYVKLSWDSEFSPVHDHKRIRREAGYASRQEYRKKHGTDIGLKCCLALWEQPQINWDGRVLGCSRNFWGEFGGNVFSDGLLNGLNSPRIRAARRTLQGDGDIPADVPCASCQVYLDRIAQGKFVSRSRPERFKRWAYSRLRTNPGARLVYYRLQDLKRHLPPF